MVLQNGGFHRNLQRKNDKKIKLFSKALFLQGFFLSKTLDICYNNKYTV